MISPTGLTVRRKPMFKKIMMLVLVCLGLLTLWGCNTVAGVGKDVKKAGEAIERSTH
jgi:predicted small secreted protein